MTAGRICLFLFLFCLGVGTKLYFSTSSALKHEIKSKKDKKFDMTELVNSFCSLLKMHKKSSEDYMPLQPKENSSECTPFCSSQ